MISVGIDLAGLEKNPTGFCVLEFNGNDKTKAKILFRTEDIIKATREASPDVVCIDAPLSLPKSGYFRISDIQLRQRGFRPLSPMFPAMKILAQRGMYIQARLKSLGLRVIEVFPRATESILGLEKERRVNEHMYDALLCALTGKYYLKGEYEILGDEIVIPKV